MIISLGHLSDWIEVDGLRVANSHEVTLSRDGTVACSTIPRAGKRPPKRHGLIAAVESHCTRGAAVSAAVMEGFSAMKIGESSKKPSSICWDGHRRCVSNLGWSFSHVDAKGIPCLQIWKVEITERTSEDGEYRSYRLDYHPLQTAKARGTPTPRIREHMQRAQQSEPHPPNLMASSMPSSRSSSLKPSSLHVGASAVHRPSSSIDDKASRDSCSTLVDDAPPSQPAAAAPDDHHSTERWKMEAAKWVLESSATDATAKAAANEWLARLFQAS